MSVRMRAVTIDPVAPWDLASAFKSAGAHPLAMGGMVEVGSSVGAAVMVIAAWARPVALAAMIAVIVAGAKVGLAVSVNC